MAFGPSDMTQTGRPIEIFAKKLLSQGEERLQRKWDRSALAAIDQPIKVLEESEVYRRCHRFISSVIRVQAVAAAELGGHKRGFLRIGDRSGEIDRAIELAAPENELVNRLTYRLACRCPIVGLRGSRERCNCSPDDLYAMSVGPRDNLSIRADQLLGGQYHVVHEFCRDLRVLPGM